MRLLDRPFPSSSPNPGTTCPRSKSKLSIHSKVAKMYWTVAASSSLLKLRNCKSTIRLRNSFKERRMPWEVRVILKRWLANNNNLWSKAQWRGKWNCKTILINCSGKSERVCFKTALLLSFGKQWWARTLLDSRPCLSKVLLHLDRVGSCQWMNWLLIHLCTRTPRTTLTHFSSWWLSLHQWSWMSSETKKVRCNWQLKLSPGRIWNLLLSPLRKRMVLQPQLRKRQSEEQMM